MASASQVRILLLTIFFCVLLRHFVDAIPTFVGSDHGGAGATIQVPPPTGQKREQKWGYQLAFGPNVWIAS
jgi:hypothetical protein